MKELDLLLESWLEHCYDSASVAQRAGFELLLSLTDPELVGYLLAAQDPPDELAQSVASVLINAHIMLNRSVKEPSDAASLQPS